MKLDLKIVFVRNLEITTTSINIRPRIKRHVKLGACELR